ncbi:GAF domain-containing protein, partial [bacterium]|nr:GAF domain-containing protein [bacterium]
PQVYTEFDDADPLGQALAAAGACLLIIVPVKTKGEVLGTLGLWSSAPVAFTGEVVDMVSAMGNQLGIALANARLYAAQVRENEKLSALLDVSGGSAQQLDLPPLLQLILQRASDLLQADGGCVVRFRSSDEEAEVVAATTALASLQGQRTPVTIGWLGAVRSSRQGRIFRPGELDDAHAQPWLQDPLWQSALIVPLVSRQAVIGVLVLTRRPGRASTFTPADLSLLEAFAGRAAVAIDNAQLLQDLHEKNELLQLLIEEAHHRIKNNLQMVSGLLQLQAETASRGDPVEQLRAANARIQAIAQVHHLLSQDEPGKVNAQTLITAIVDALVMTSTRSPRTPEVSLELSPLWLSSEQAIALALIVNELLANSLLHGRPPASDPLQVEVSCQRHGAHARLRVGDNGGGLPPGMDWRQSEGQGMNIVAQLARVNLRGSLEMTSRAGGLCAELQFEVLDSPAAGPPGAGTTSRDHTSRDHTSRDQT